MYVFDQCILDCVISNKDPLHPSEYKTEPEWTGYVWYSGYSFKHFWGNCAALLGDMAKLEGIQQLVHQYYLQNGSLGAIKTVERIKKLIGSMYLAK